MRQLELFRQMGRSIYFAILAMGLTLSFGETGVTAPADRISVRWVSGSDEPSSDTPMIRNVLLRMTQWLSLTKQGDPRWPTVGFRDVSLKEVLAEVNPESGSV